MSAAALLAGLLLCAQEPAPEPGAAPPEQEPEQEQQDGDAPQRETVTLEQVEEAMARVSERLAESTAKLQTALDRAGQEEGGDEALGEAMRGHELLVQEMEHLLEILPEPPPPPPDGGGGGSQRQPRPEAQGERPRPEEIPERPDRSLEEDPDGRSEPLDAPRSMFLNELQQGAWGQLPPRLQQSIEAAAVADLPLRYRRWLVEYHRRAVAPR